MTRAIVIGYGSSGRRHARVLSELGCEVTVVSRRPLKDLPRYSDIAAAVRETRPGYAVIATETTAHVGAVEALAGAGFDGKLLIEKPLGRATSGHAFSLCAVAYNLRFHPALSELASALSGEKIVSMQAYCGQYLPDWRAGIDYRKSYSADPARGGGVLRDLSHELDYLLWLGGDWRRIAALGGRLGELEIASDDCWGLLVELDHCPCATVQVNYLDQPGRRQLVVNTTRHTYFVDFEKALLMCDGEAREFSVDRNDTYRAQHQAMLAGDASRVCSLAEGAQVMSLIAAAERAAEEGIWVNA